MTDIIDRLVRYAGSTCLSTMTELAAAAEIKKLRAEIEAMKQQKPAAWREFDGEGGYDYRSFNDNENFRDEYIKRNGNKYATWVEPLYLATGAQSDLNLACPSVQKRLAAQWGYVRSDAQAVPEGFQLVPIEPTPEMLARTSAPGCAKSDWEKMIAAAPKPEDK